MADIEVTKVPKIDVNNKDMEFTIKEGGQKVGEIKISKGSIDIKPKNKQGYIKVNWSEFFEKFRS